MNHSIRVTRRPRRAWPPAARTAAAIIATAVLALLAAACGGSPSSTGSGGSSQAGGSTNSQLLAFARCMRSNGVPHFPDPDPSSSNEKFPTAQQLGVGSSQYQAAASACQHLLPPGVDDQFPPAEVQLLLPGMRNFSQCMRSHGVPNFPDPSIDDQGRPVFDLSDAGFSRQETHSPQFDTLMQECDHLLPRQLGGALLALTANPQNPFEVDVRQPSAALVARAQAQSALNGLFLGLGAVALLVGAVGVANIMVISVLERRSEIGLRRALGATRGNIRSQFLFEAVLLGGLGGLVGVALGVLSTAVYAGVKGWGLVVPVEAWAGGLAAALIIGGVAGLLPALRAARMSPTEALRSV